MQKVIFHIHNQICNHASITFEQVVDYALKHGYTTLYFTEHAPLKVKCLYQQRRPQYDEIVDLKHKIDLANKKHKNKLKIYFGYEIEYNKPDIWYIKTILKDPIPEFLIYGNHFYGSLFAIKKLPSPLVVYTTKSLAQLKEFDENNKIAFSSGLFSWIAHPELFLNSYRKWDKHAKHVCQNIIKWAIKYKLPLGFNVNFEKPWDKKDVWHYPCIYFWKMVAKTKVPVIIESDAHSMHPLTVEWMDKARKLAIKWGLKKNLTESIPIKWLKKPRS